MSNVADLTLQRTEPPLEYPQTEQRPEEGPDGAMEGTREVEDLVVQQIAEAQRHLTRSLASNGSIGHEVQQLRLALKRLARAVELLSERRA